MTAGAASEAERAALFALLAAFECGDNCREDGERRAPTESDVEFALDYVADMPPNFRRDVVRERLAPLARRLVAMIRSEALHNTAAAFDRIAAEDERWANRACLVGGMVAGLAVAGHKREAARMLRAAARKESTNAE